MTFLRSSHNFAKLFKPKLNDPLQKYCEFQTSIHPRSNSMAMREILWAGPVLWWRRWRSFNPPFLFAFSWGARSSAVALADTSTHKHLNITDQLTDTHSAPNYTTFSRRCTEIKCKNVSANTPWHFVSRIEQHNLFVHILYS